MCPVPDLQESFERSPLPVFLAGADGGVQYRNPACQRLADGIPSDAAEDLARAIRRVAADQEPSSLSLWTSDLQAPCLEVALAPMPGLVCGVVHEVGAYRRLLEETRAREFDLATTLDSISNAVFVTDLQGHVVRLNRAAEGLSGKKLQEVVGQSLAEVFPLVDEHTGRLPESRVARTLSTGLADSHPGYLVLFHNGQRRLLAEDSAPIRDRQGGVRGVVLVYRDVTAQVELEEQLRQAQKMEVIGQLAGGIAHDFNNLLAGMLGYAEIMKDSLADRPTEMAYCESLIQLTLRASDLTTKLLTFSRRGQFQAQPVDMNELILEVIELLSHTIDRRIEIRERLDAEPAIVRGDRSQLQSGILNLAVNARDAMPNGGILSFSTGVLLVDAEFCRQHPQDLRPGPYLELAVADTGVGMDRETVSHIFEPFFTTKAKGKGTGLGLAAVYGTVRGHQGVIKVESEPDKGSLFRLFLPLDPEAKTDYRPGDTTTVIFGTGRILLVDDEPIIREMAGEMLRNMGYKVTVAEDGQIALDKFREGSAAFDLVILDMVMPRMNGRDTFYALREIDPRVRVVISSGFVMGQELQELDTAGIYGFLPKPYRKSALSRAVAHALSRVPK